MNVLLSMSSTVPPAILFRVGQVYDDHVLYTVQVLLTLCVTAGLVHK